MNELSIRVFEGTEPDELRSVLIRRVDYERCEVHLIDHFITQQSEPFLKVPLEYRTLLMILDGACIATKTPDACFALVPLGTEMRVTFQGDDWPYPTQWTTLREEFARALREIL